MRGPTDVAAWAGARLKEIVADLGLLVDTETPSTDPVLLAAGFEVLTGWLARRWPSADVRVTGAGPGAVAAVEVPGTRPGTVVLLGHLDTVFDTGTVARRPFTVAHGLARGPGVFDMKAGLVIGVWALAALVALGLPRPTVRLLVNADEEVGTHGSRDALIAGCRDAGAVLVLEPGGAAGTVKTARKGVGIWTVTATGVAAHAGLDPETGASAVHALAALTTDLVALADPAAGTTLNVGVLGGGTRANVTAASARLELDVRAATPGEAERVSAALRDWRPSDPRVRLDVDGGWNRPPWRADPILVDAAREVAEALGVPFEAREVGGASDGNIVAAATGLAVLDGLGASGEGAHAEHEHVVVADLPVRVALLAGLLTRL